MINKKDYPGWTPTQIKIREKMEEIKEGAVDWSITVFSNYGHLNVWDGKSWTHHEIRL